ncbi:hypothetical protein LXL04_037154 [Taraxacum kok-saghyz]
MNNPYAGFLVKIRETACYPQAYVKTGGPSLTAEIRDPEESLAVWKSPESIVFVNWRKVDANVLVNWRLVDSISVVLESRTGKTKAYKRSKEISLENESESTAVPVHGSPVRFHRIAVTELSGIPHWLNIEFITRTETPVRLIKALFGQNGGFFQRGKPAVGTSLWSKIIAAEVKMQVVGVVPQNTLRCRVGNGCDTRFWEDCWIGEALLANLFPRLAALESDRHCLVSNRKVGVDWSWSSEDPDKWVWDISMDGSFLMAETRKWIDDLVLPQGIGITRWCKLVHRKVNIFRLAVVIG